MKLIDLRTGEQLDAKIEKASEEDLFVVEKEKKFDFNWRLLASDTVYKLVLADNGKVVGLIALRDIPEEIRLHIELLESSKENVGNKKQLDRIPGCLIAFACSLSFKKGYEGFVSLVPKTKLINHYVQKYGFRRFGKMLAIEDQDARYLIIKYLNDGAQESV